MAHHKNQKNRREKINDESQGQLDEEDPYDLRIKNSGCAEFHFALQDCFLETQDWRQCQKQMKDFRECMANQEKKKNPK